MMVAISQKCIAFVKFAYAQDTHTHTHICRGQSLAVSCSHVSALHYPLLSNPYPPSCRPPRQSQVNYLFVHFRWPRSHKNVIYFTASTCLPAPLYTFCIYLHIPGYTCVYLVHTYSYLPRPHWTPHCALLRMRFRISHLYAN